MTTVEITPVHGLPQDSWNEILSSCDFRTLKACSCISKIFTQIVELDSIYTLQRFHLDKENYGKSSFKRIISIGNLFQEWTKASKYESSGFPSELIEFNKYFTIGINCFSESKIDLSNRIFCYNNKIYKFVNFNFFNPFKKCSIPSSIQEILAFVMNHIGKDDSIGLAVKKIAYLTPYVDLGDDDRRKQDLIDLFVRNLNDLPFLLNYNPKRADKLLNQDFTNLAKEHIETLILFYLCNHDIKRLQKLIALIKEKGWIFNVDLAKKRPGLQKILTSSYDDEDSSVLELLLFYQKELENITSKTLVSHVCAIGNASLLKKLRDTYKIDLALDNFCFHYARNVEIAEILFESGANINSDLDFLSPLAKALEFYNDEVAAFLIDKNADLHGFRSNPLSNHLNLNTFQLLVKKVRTISLIRFLYPTNVNRIFQKIKEHETWIVLKELAYRITRIAVLIFSAFASIGIIELAYPGSCHSFSTIVILSLVPILTCLQFAKYKY